MREASGRRIARLPARQSAVRASHSGAVDVGPPCRAIGTKDAV